MMVRPSFATPLSLILALSIMLGGFSATAHAQRLEDHFTLLQRPLEMPSFVVEALSGQKLLLADIIREHSSKGRVILHTWGTYCPPCIDEIKEIDALQERLSQNGVYIVAVAQEDDGLTTVPAFQLRHRVKLRDVYIDPRQALLMKLRADGVPMSYLLTQDGKLAGIHVGTMDWSALLKN